MDVQNRIKKIRSPHVQEWMNKIYREAGKAVKIDFTPLKTSSFSLTSDYEVLVAHSSVEAPKTREVMDKYNRRSIECRLAAAMIAKSLALDIHYMGDLPSSWYSNDEAIRENLEDILKTEGYSKKNLCNSLSVTEDQLNKQWCYRKDGSIFPEPEEGYLLYKRAYHVLSEWKRVEDSHKALSEKKIALFGKLMNESHDSCRDNHQISCRELDRLIKIGSEGTAAGCRLTGAGFGGCTVHLIKKIDSEAYKEYLLEHYYRNYLKITDGEKFLFPVKPSDGAAILEELFNE